MVWICSYGIPDCPECKRDDMPLRWSTDTATDRLYFHIPFAEKNDAKPLGARWDPDLRAWYSLLNNPKLSTIGKRWPPNRRANAKWAVADAAQRAAPQPAARSVPARQPDLIDRLIEEPYTPPPGSVPWDEFMPALRAAEEVAQPAKPRERSDVQIPVHVQKENRK